MIMKNGLAVVLSYEFCCNEIPSSSLPKAGSFLSKDNIKIAISLMSSSVTSLWDKEDILIKIKKRTRVKYNNIFFGYIRK